MPWELAGRRRSDCGGSPREDPLDTPQKKKTNKRSRAMQPGPETPAHLSYQSLANGTCLPTAALGWIFLQGVTHHGKSCLFWSTWHMRASPGWDWHWPPGWASRRYCGNGLRTCPARRRCEPSPPGKPGRSLCWNHFCTRWVTPAGPGERADHRVDEPGALGPLGALVTRNALAGAPSPEAREERSGPGKIAGRRRTVEAIADEEGIQQGKAAVVVG